MLKNLAVVVLLGVLIGSMGCATICPVVQGQDTPTHDVLCAIAVATEIDALAAPLAVIPALSAAYLAYHTALGPAIAMLQAALQTYESVKSDQSLTTLTAAMTFLVDLYKAFDKLWKGHGAAGLVAQAKLNVAQPGYTCKNWKR